MNDLFGTPRRRTLFLVILASLAVPPARAEPTASAPASPPVVAGVHAPHPLPTLRFNGDPVTADLFDMLQKDSQFSQLSKEAFGSPLELRAYHTYRIGRGAAAATGFLAALTLGLIPQVSSGSHAVVYEILVNGEVLCSYRYDTELTRVKNMWVQDTTHGLGEDGLKWVRSTADRFLNDAAEDPRLAALREEFEYYFGPPAGN